MIREIAALAAQSKLQAVRWFEELDRTWLAEAGGKGANLGELTRAGLPVPAGFVVTAGAYRAALAASGLDERIAARIAALDAHDLTAIAAASAEIGAWIVAAPVPDTLATAIERAYAELCARESADTDALPVAVRSSATAEDLPDASFAGQQETFLHIRGAATLLEHVRRCWASLWTAQAISYRASMGFDHGAVALAVVVQSMAPAQVAGVMFTANPVSGRADEILISASYGLGESVVSGSVTPDTFVLAPDGAVRARALGAKETRIVPDGAGTRTEPVPADQRARFCLSAADLHALAAMAARVQAHYGAPQDTEWALSNGRLALLQARPITTLAKQSAPAIDLSAPPINRKVFGVKQLLEYWPEPPTPLDISFFRETSRSSAVLYGMFGMRPARELPEPVEQPDGRIGARISNPTFTPAALWQIPGRLLFTFGDPLARWQVVRSAMDQAEARWQASFIDNTDAAARGRLIEQAMGEFGELLGRRFGAVFFSGIKYLLQIKLWTLIAAGRAGAAQLEDRLMRAAPFRTALQNQAVTRLAQVAAAHGKTSPEFEAALAAFMDEWGTRPARGMATLPSTPSWREDPAQVLGLVDALLADPDALALEAALRREEADYQAARAQAGASIWAPLRGWFRTSLERARSGLVAREDSLFRMEALTDAIRRLAQSLGVQLAEGGKIDEAGDVFFLLASELEAVGAGTIDAHERIARRKRGYAAIAAAHERGEHWLVATGSVAPEVVIDRKAAQRAAQSAGGNTLSGLAASAGQITAPVCVIRGPHEFGRMVKGAVLVAPFTAPAWTPLFRLASAVVTEIGSPVSHAAIVAREYGIPAVVAVPGATSTLRDGQCVLVDGTRGVVTIVAEGGAQ